MAISGLLPTGEDRPCEPCTPSLPSALGGVSSRWVPGGGELGGRRHRKPGLATCVDRDAWGAAGGHRKGTERMALTADHFKALVRRHMEGDDDGFYSVALQVAARAAREGKNRFAQDLRELIDSAKGTRAATALRPVPMVQPRGELAGLMTVSYPDVFPGHDDVGA